MGSLDREIDAALMEFIKGIGKFFKKVGVGVKKLNKLPNIIGFLVTLLIAILVWLLKESLYLLLDQLEMPVLIQKIVVTIFVCLPVIYLAILGTIKDKKQEEYNKKFASIGFKGKTGYPIYLSDSEDEEKRITYIFKSDINVGEWKKKKEALETALDCIIWDVKNKKSKKIVQITAVSSDHELPAMIQWDDSFMLPGDGEIVVGQGIIQSVSFNLNKNAHVLAAGETGSGKSVILRCCLWQMIKHNARVYMIDFKGGVEFGIDYEKYGEVIMDRERAVEVLEMLVKENQERLVLFRKLKVKNLPEYNRKTGKNLCRIGVFCDEIAEMLDRKGVSKEDKPIYDRLEGLISSLARLARATGINLFLGVQRPDANVLTGQIKNNIPVRMCGRFADKSASEIVLNSTAATDLPEIKGRFLFQRGNELIEFQSYYFDDETMLKEIDVTTGTMMIDAGTDYYTDDSAYQDSYAYDPPKVKPAKSEPAVKSPEELRKDYGDIFDDDADCISWGVDD